MSLERTGSIRRDATKSTAEGEWEMRDGKWYRKDYFAVEAPPPPPPPPVKAPFVCKDCPGHITKIQMITKEIEELKLRIAERDRLIAELKARLEKWEIESRNWMAERSRLEARIRELEALLRAREGWLDPSVLREKELIIAQLQERIRLLLAEKENLINKLARLAEMIESFEKQWAICKAKGFCCNQREEPPPPPPPPVVTERYYYAVQDPQYISLFQSSTMYKGGDIVVEGMDGATVVNPEYYSQSEAVPGMSRIRVRVVDFKSMSGAPSAGAELFVRLKLGEAIQFTQARPCTLTGASWNQDMVFVEVPLRAHPRDVTANVSVHPLVVEVISRAIGSVSENVIGSQTIELTDLVHSITRATMVELGSAGILHLRIKALDFGLIPAGNYVHGWKALIQGMIPPGAYTPETAHSTTLATVERILAGSGDFPSAIIPKV